MALLGLGACIQPAAFPCERDEQCDAGEAGICHPEAGYCAYADEGCNSGLRFDANAPRPYADACVGDVQVTGTDSDTESSSSSSSSTTGVPGCGGPLQECCEPDDSCDGPWECAGSGCTCTDMIVAGDVHTCVVRLDGVVECWGGNERGELGRTEPSSSLPDPAPVQGLPGGINVVSAAAREHTCLVASNGDVYCWGDNTFDQADPTGPGLVVDPPRVVADSSSGWVPQIVGVGPRHTCVAGEGRMSCWGNNDAGQLGFAGEGPQEVDTSGLSGQIRDIAGGFAHTCVLTEDGGTDHVYCWGADDTGQLGGGAGDQSGTTPVEVSLGDERVFGLSASDVHTCAIVGPDDSREVLCWGNNEQGQAVGPNAAGTIDSPSSVNGLAQGDWIRLLAAPEHTCVTSDDSTAFCWGSNSAGRVDPVGSGDLLGATEVAMFDSVGRRPLSVHPGKFHTCAATDDGSISCWGCGGLGQLGPDLATCENGAGFSAVAPACAG